jgi:SNF2 family DNA or RNA helicase
MSPEQRKLYREMKDKYLAELEDGTVVTAPMALTRMLRLQQILGGFINDEFGDTHVVDGPNSKLDALMYDLDDVPETASVIIWARFRREIETIYDAVTKHFGGGSAGKYYGGVPNDVRRQLIKDFQDKKVRFFIGTPQAGAHGITLTAAQIVYYFSNDFSLENRIQSEDRAHRIGQVNKVTYKDIVVPGTVDMHVLKALKNKQSLSDLVQGGLKTYKNILKGE